MTNTAEKGPGSFAAAARRAQSDRDRDVIAFRSGLRGAIRLEQGVRFSHAVVLRGPGGIDSNFSLKGPRSGSKLSFDDIFDHGTVDGDEGAKAAIRGLHLKRVSISGLNSRVDLVNSRVSGSGTADGAGFYNYGYGDTSHIRRSTITGWEQGVAVYDSELHIDQSVISGNQPGGGLTGGGYSNTRISASLISGNTGPSGGLIAFYYADVDMTNSTITGNVATAVDGPGVIGAHGGGVSGDVEVNESTITGNTAQHGGGVGSYPGSGGYATVTNSIVANNESTDPADGEDCAKGVNSGGGNLIESPGACNLKPGDLFGVDPLLGPLADNGGPTSTQALKRGSPAIGLAIPKKATRKDQRGVRRDGDPDSGAYERRTGRPG